MNEHMNGLIRQDFLKEADFDQVTDEKVATVERKLNCELGSVSATGRRSRYFVAGYRQNAAPPVVLRLLLEFGRGFLCCMPLLAGVVQAGHAVHWSYLGEEGPESWGHLSPDYHVCADGRDQSPVNIEGAIEAEMPPLEFNYHKGGSAVLNNGHTIQVSYLAGSTLAVNGREFELKQFHFHAPSENHIEGKGYPMEMHLVHADKEGNLAVVAVMITEGRENETLTEIWRQMPEQAGGKKDLQKRISVKGLLPASKDYYRFNGSLTTPPCTEGVRWYVMKQPLTVSVEQVRKFRHIMHHHNNRPVQPVYARPLLK